MALTVLGGALILAGLIWILVLRADTADPTEVVGGDRLEQPESQTTAAASTATEVPEPVTTPVSPLEPETPTPEPMPTATPQVQSPASAEPEVTAAPDPDPTATSVERERVAASPPIYMDTDLGTGSSEFSAVTLNEEFNRLLVADDEDRLFEFDLTPDGEPIVPPRRTIRVAVGAGDIEGIAWMSGSTYAIAHEDDGALTIVQFGDDVSTIAADHLLQTIDTRVREEDGHGLEGVAVIRGSTGDLAFAVVDERPPTLHLIDQAGTVVQSIAVDIGVSDISDVWVSDDGVYSVVSDEGRVVVDLTVDASGAITVIETIALTVGASRFEQPEGVARSRNGDRLYVVGEDPGPGRLSFGLWRFG